MTDDNKPLGKQYYEAVEALKADGMSNADAIRKVAADMGKAENAVRGGLHQYRARHQDGAGAPGRGRRRPTASVDDHLADARRSLEQALRLIDGEVDRARAELDAAQARYDETTASVAGRKADIERKLAALT